MILVFAPLQLARAFEPRDKDIRWFRVDEMTANQLADEAIKYIIG